MDEQQNCPKCEGGGCVDSKDGKPWHVVTATVNQDQRSGAIRPLSCDQCRGTGKVPKPQAPPVEPAAAPAQTAAPKAVKKG